MSEAVIRNTSLLTEEFASLLAEHSHSTINEVYEILSSCAQCRQNAIYHVVVLEGESCLGNSDPGKLRLAFYGLCEVCVTVPNIIHTINKTVFDRPRTPKRDSFPLCAGSASFTES